MKNEDWVISRVFLYSSSYTAIDAIDAWNAAVMDDGDADTGCCGDGKNGRWMYVCGAQTGSGQSEPSWTGGWLRLWDSLPSSGRPCAGARTA